MPGGDTPVLPAGCGLGTAPLGSGPGWLLDWGHIERADALATVRGATRAGVGWIDTAPFYGWGRAETIVGSALDGASQRPALLTKCGTFRRADGRSYEDHGADAIRADLTASLARLRCEAVDVLQLHDPDPGTPIERAWDAVQALVADGMARAAGLSNHPVELLDRAAAVGPVAVVQQQYSLLHRAPEADGVLDWCASHGATFLAWSPLASGFLADGFALTGLGPGDFRRNLPWADPARLDLQGLRATLTQLAQAAGLSLTALAVGWVLARGARPIIGARTASEATAIAGYRPLPAGLAQAAQDAVARAMG